MTGRLLAGGGVLLHRVTGWWTTDGVMSGIARVIGTLLAVAASGGVLLAAPVLWWPLAACWLITCWYAKPAPCECQDEQTSTDPAEFLRIVHALAEGRKAGVHLAEIAARLTGDPKATATVRELCETVGIPIASGVRVKGRGVSTGVKVADLPPLPGPSPDAPVGVVAAGQASNNNSNNTLGRIVQDPSGDPNRFTVEWDERPAYENA